MNKALLTSSAFMALTLSVFAAPAPKDAKHPWFVKHDANGDGFITKQEFVTARAAFYVEKKKISQEEAQKWAEKSFQRADKNKDGKVTAKEFFADKK